jgi:hypothetical protein
MHHVSSRLSIKINDDSFPLFTYIFLSPLLSFPFEERRVDDQIETSSYEGNETEEGKRKKRREDDRNR